MVHILPQAMSGNGLQSGLPDDLRLETRAEGWASVFLASALKALQSSSSLSILPGPTLSMYSPAQILHLGAGLRAEVPMTDLLLY